MSKHFGEMKIYDNETQANSIAFRCPDKLVFVFDNYTITVEQIKNLSVCPNGEIVIELALFSPHLYNAWASDCKIKTLTENGKCFIIPDATEEVEYSTGYKNYKFKSYSGSRNNGDWVYVLEPVDDISDMWKKLEPRNISTTTPSIFNRKAWRDSKRGLCDGRPPLPKADIISKRDEIYNLWNKKEK